MVVNTIHYRNTKKYSYPLQTIGCAGKRATKRASIVSLDDTLYRGLRDC